MSLFKGFKGKTKTKRSLRKPIKKTGVYNKGVLQRCCMRENQREVFVLYGCKDYVIVIQPPGAGKSTLIKFIFAYSLRKFLEKKAIIAIPQTIIRKTFLEIELEFDDGKRVKWDIKNDKTDIGSKDIVKDLIKFMKKKTFLPGNKIRDRVFLCTHAALAYAYAQIDEEREGEHDKKKEYFRNTMFNIDEAHHILDSRYRNNDVVNKMGKFINYILAHSEELNNKIWLTTATMFRGDGMDVISPKYSTMFDTYFLPLDKHMEENVQYLKSYSYDMVIYKGSPFGDIKKIMKNKKNQVPTIVYCPRQDSILANGCKYTFVRSAMEEVASVWKGVKQVDLVTEDNRFGEGDREIRKQQIFDEALAKGIDVVYVVDIFNEGADWEDACQIIDLSPTNSLRLLYQRFGRLLRDKKGKTHIHYYTFLPFVIDQLDALIFRKRVTNHFASLTASMLLEELIRPVSVVSALRKGKKGSRKERSNPFREEIVDPIVRGNILIEVEKRLFALGELYNEVSAKNAKREILKVLKSKKVKNRTEDIATQIIAIFNRRIPSNFGLDISEVVENGFDEMWDSRICQPLTGFGSGICGKKTYKSFRKCLGAAKPKYTLEEAKEIAQQAGLSGGLQEWQEWKESQRSK